MPTAEKLHIIKAEGYLPANYNLKTKTSPSLSQ